LAQAGPSAESEGEEPEGDQSWPPAEEAELMEGDGSEGSDPKEEPVWNVVERRT
jgi:hypothetical protein